MLPQIYTSAFLCEQVLREKNDVTSAIRMTDIFTVNVLPHAPDSVVLARVDTTLVIIFKSELPCEFTAAIEEISPEGKEFGRSEFQVRLRGAPHGHNIHMRLTINAVLPGLYWFNVMVDEDIVQRVPLEVKHTAVAPPRPDSQPPSEPAP